MATITTHGRRRRKRHVATVTASNAPAAEDLPFMLVDDTVFASLPDDGNATVLKGLYINQRTLYTVLQAVQRKSSPPVDSTHIWIHLAVC